MSPICISPSVSTATSFAIAIATVHPQGRRYSVHYVTESNALWLSDQQDSVTVFKNIKAPLISLVSPHEYYSYFFMVVLDLQVNKVT